MGEELTGKGLTTDRMLAREADAILSGDSQIEKPLPGESKEPEQHVVYDDDGRQLLSGSFMG
jgi:hypothetical protein